MENITRSKIREKLGKPVLAFALLNFLKDIFCLCTFLVSHVYDLITTVTNQCSLFPNSERVVKGVQLLISLCGYLQL